MKMLAVNGSPNEKGNTYHAISIVASALKTEGIDTEILHIGHKGIRGCIGCGQCAKRLDGTCALPDDGVNEAVAKMKAADSLLFASPVYYAGIAGTMKCFLDRTFYVMSKNGNPIRHKVAAAVVVVRRSGGVTTFDQLSHYLNFAELLIPASNYWNVIHGRTPGEVLSDEEGVQTLRLLGKNMAYLMKLVQNGQGKVEAPAKEAKITMHFIR